MGKGSIIVVLGVSIIVTFFILRLNANSKQNLSNTISMFEQTQARLIANTGVEIYLEKLYADHSLINTTSSKQNLFNGSYIVNLSGTLPNVRVTSTATFEDVQHISIADAWLEPIYFPDLPAGMYISSAAVASAAELGDMHVSGANHDINGVLKGTGKPAVFGIGVDSDADRNLVLNNLLKPQNIVGLIDTSIGYPSVGVTNLGINWGKIYQYLANAADQTFIGNIPNGTLLGTLTEPKITLVNAEASSNNQIIINSASGAGILVVNGNVKFTGNCDFKGIVLCYKNSDLTYESMGTNNILGGIVAAGTVHFKLLGTMNVNYSLDVINSVKSNLKANGFKILSWYE
jgi:hypothetical protein